MARILDRIWVRFGLIVSAAILMFVVVLLGGLLIMSNINFQQAQSSPALNFPSGSHNLAHEDHSTRSALTQVMGAHRAGDTVVSERLALALAILGGLSISMVLGVYVSRVVTQPLESMATAAMRVASGDLTVRAEGGNARGEMATMIGDFNHMIDSLETLDKEQRATLASVSHELRTPLAVLTARLYGICDGVIQGDEKEMRGLLDQSLHLSRLVDDLRTLTLASAGRLSLQVRKVNLTALAADSLAGFEPRLAEQGFTVETQFSPELAHHAILADQDRLRQIFGNLVENALRHASSGCWIKVATYIEDDHAVLALSDAGPGLPRNVRDQPFQRFPHPPGDAHNGSGLGLSIVRALTHQQGGCVVADASERHGARIRVSFPLARHTSINSP